LLRRLAGRGCRQALEPEHGIAVGQLERRRCEIGILTIAIDLGQQLHGTVAVNEKVIMIVMQARLLAAAFPPHRYPQIQPRP
jgi:hypothetical protein